MTIRDCVAAVSALIGADSVSRIATTVPYRLLPAVGTDLARLNQVQFEDGRLLDENSYSVRFGHHCIAGFR